MDVVHLWRASPWILLSEIVTHLGRLGQERGSLKKLGLGEAGWKDGKGRPSDLEPAPAGKRGAPESVSSSH